jgi:hypothetical protein
MALGDLVKSTLGPKVRSLRCISPAPSTPLGALELADPRA